MMPRNGNGGMSFGMGMDMLGMMPSLLPPAPFYSNDDIVRMVDQHERDMEPLRTRMEGDFSRYHLTSHINRDKVTGEPIRNTAVYTSPAPKVFADKVISWQTLAELLIRVPHLEVGRHEEEQDNLKERLAIGCLRSADERLTRLAKPSLRNQFAFNCTVLGGYIGGRCLLVKDPRTGKTYPDITVFDPMHTHWGVGADGLDWICHKIKKTRSQIHTEYGIDVAGDIFTSGPSFFGSSDAQAEGIEVYDFYDGQINTVITAKEILKPPTPHGSPRVPAFLVLVGPVPLLQSQSISNPIVDVGESIFSSAREIWDNKNTLMSIVKQIVEQARDQSVILESLEGTKTLKANPLTQPTLISTQRGDKIYTLEMQKLADVTMAYIAMVTGEEQRATLPYVSYGEPPFQLSGFAITQLRQATLTVLISRIEAQSSMYLQVVNLLNDQFMTGAFDGMRLSGIDSNRSYFNQIITPEQLADTCDYEVKLVSQLPQDDASKWATAQIAKTLGLMSDVDILNDIVGAQDAQQVIDKVRAQKAEEGLPEAQLYTLMMAAANRGETEIAQMYLADWQRMMMVKLGIMPDMAPGQGGGGKGQGTPPKAPGPRPEVLPYAATGAPPPPETSNQGPSQVAPGTPRPGAQGQSA